MIGSIVRRSQWYCCCVDRLAILCRYIFMYHGNTYTACCDCRAPRRRVNKISHRPSLQMHRHAARREKPGHSFTTQSVVYFVLHRQQRTSWGTHVRALGTCPATSMTASHAFWIVGGEGKDRPLNTLPRSPFGAALRRNAVDFGCITCVRDCGGEGRDRPLNTLPRSPFDAALRRTAVEYFQHNICPYRMSARRGHLRRQQPLSTR